MSITMRAYTEQDLPTMIDIWNEAIAEGNSLPWDIPLTPETGAAFFAAQDHTGVAVDDEAGCVRGVYILHPNSVGHSAHVCNCSYAVQKASRGQHIGEKLVLDSIAKGKGFGYRIMQFNAVVESNAAARHLYERLGFVYVGTVPGSFRMLDGSYENMVLYYYDLTK